MAIIREYECPDCSERLGRPYRFEKFHRSSDEPPPPCPGCEAMGAEKVVSAPYVASNTHAKAMDITQDIIENDYGMSNMRDNMREGDIAAIVPAKLEEQSRSIFSNQPAQSRTMMPDLIARAREGAAAARAESRNPLSMLQGATKKRSPGGPKVVCRPVNRVT